MSKTRILPHIETLASAQRGEVWRADIARSLDHPVLFWLTRGQGKFMVETQLRGVGPHTAVFVPANTLFSYEVFARPLGMVVSFPSDADLGLPLIPALLRATSVQLQAEINRLIDHLVEERAEVRPGQARALDAYMMMISVWLDRMLEKQPQPSAKPAVQVPQDVAPERPKAQAIPATIDSFAADLKASASHLTHLTQAGSSTDPGKPVSDAAQEQVIHAACDDLMNSDRPVKDISERLGFSSPDYFTRAFQAYTGKSPSDFRKSRRAN